MSDIFYPLAAIERLEIERVNRVLIDPFEDGTQSASRRWGLRNFKRRFHLTHAPLRSWEAEALLGFHADRSGPYETFWFRDHIFKTGSASVRFPDGFKLTRQGLMTGAEVILEESAPSAAIPTAQQLFTAAGDQAPLVWHDPNRLKYFTHPSGVATTATLYSETTITDQMLAYDAAWQHGSTLYPALYKNPDYWNFTGTQWAQTVNPTQLSGTQPAITLLCFFKFAPTAGYMEGVPVFVGTTGSATGLGVFQTNGQNWKITDGSTRYGTSLDADAYVWQSISVSVAASSNSVDLVKNGVLLLTQSITRNHTAGPLTIGAYSDGTKKLNDTGVMSYAQIGQVMLWNAKLTTAQLKAVHNLFAPGYSLAQVA